MDSEEEVIFKNSPLYNYLVKNSICTSNIQSEEKMYISKKCILKETNKFHDFDNIDTSIKTYLAIIFQSELLLKEDYEILQFIYSTTPLQTRTYSISKKVCMILAFSTFIIANKFKKTPYIHILTTSIVPASYCFFQIYKSWKSKTNIESIVLQTKTILSKVRNLVKLLYDYDVLLISSKRADEHSSSSIKLNLFRQVLFDNMKNVINTFNNAVQKINTLIDVSLKKDGIISAKEDKNQSITTIYNLLLLSQSEFFLYVGYVFCTTASYKYNMVFETIISNTQIELNSHVDIFLFLYNNFLCVSFVPEENTFNTGTNLISLKELHYSLQNICLLLHSMLTNSADILQLFEENSNEEIQKNILKRFCQSSQILETDLKMLESYFNMLQINLKKCTHRKNNSPICIATKETVTKNLLKINFDDKEINCDEIFEACVDNDIEQIQIKNYEENDLLKKSQVEAYKLLLNELKPILKDKKQEWEIREKKIRQTCLCTNENINTSETELVEVNSQTESLQNEKMLTVTECPNEVLEKPDLSYILKQIKKPINYGKKKPSKYEHLTKKQNLIKTEEISSEINTPVNTIACNSYKKEFAQILIQQRPPTFLQEDYISDGESSDV